MRALVLEDLMMSVFKLPKIWFAFFLSDTQL
jgi:hypothetical protein